MSVEFPMDRDIYTSAELAAYFFNLGIEEVTLQHINIAVRTLAKMGRLRAIHNRAQVRWPGGVERHIMYSVRNHQLYIEPTHVIAHLAPHKEPRRWSRSYSPAPKRVSTTFKVKKKEVEQPAAPVDPIVELEHVVPAPLFSEERDLYTSGEVASAVFQRPVAELSEKRLGTTLAVKRGWAKLVNGGKMIRWPGVKINPLFLYSVRNHELYDTAAGVRKHLLGVEYPGPRA
jgi:hypothetical protein